MFSCFKHKKKQLQQPEPSQWQRKMVSAPTYQPRKIDMENDRLQGKSETIVKPVVPYKQYALDNSVRYQSKHVEKLQSKRDDGGFGFMTAASTSAIFGGDSGGNGDSSCGGGGGGHGDNSCGGGGGGCGSC